MKYNKQITQGSQQGFVTAITQEITQQINSTLEKSFEQLQQEMRQELKYAIQHVRRNHFVSLQKEFTSLNIMTKKSFTLEQIMRRVAIPWLQ